MGKVQMNVWVEPEEREALKAAAEARGVSLGELVRQVARSVMPKQGGAAEVDDLRGRVAGLEEQVESYERRLSRLEEMAGF